MFGISFEHLLIVGIVLLIFGPRRLPELGQTMGKAIRNFKDALSGVEEAKFRRIEEERNASAAASGLKTQVNTQAQAPATKSDDAVQQQSHS